MVFSLMATDGEPITYRPRLNSRILDEIHAARTTMPSLLLNTVFYDLNPLWVKSIKEVIFMV